MFIIAIITSSHTYIINGTEYGISVYIIKVDILTKKEKDMDYELSGKVDVSLNGITIPASLLSDEGVTTTLTETIREIPTMAGTIRQATGIYEEANAVFNVVLPNMNYLKNIFPELYTASTDRPTLAGQVKFGSNTCTTRENTPLVVHYTCQANSDNDIYIPNGSVVASIELTQNASNPVVVAVTVQAQPDDDGVFAYAGTGDLTQPTKWNAVTETYDPLTSS